MNVKRSFRLRFVIYKGLMKKTTITYAALAALAIALAVVAVKYFADKSEVAGKIVPEQQVIQEQAAKECVLDVSSSEVPEGWAYVQDEYNCVALALPSTWRPSSTNGSSTTYTSDEKYTITLTISPISIETSFGYRLVDGDVDKYAMPGSVYHEYVEKFENQKDEVTTVRIETEEKNMSADSFIAFSEKVLATLVK